MFEKYKIGKIVYIVMERLDWSKVDRLHKTPRKYWTVVEGKIVQHANEDGIEYCVCQETKEPKTPFDFVEDDCGVTVFTNYFDANNKLKTIIA